MMYKGRIGKGDHHDWLSRDWLDIDCRATGCIYNAGGKCMVPSRCKINPDGRCAGFEAKPMPRVDGD